MNPEPDPEKIKRSNQRMLWQLSYAKEHFKEAKTALSECIKESMDKTHPCYTVLTSSAVMNYAAPFIAGNEATTLTSGFSSFPDDAMKELHNGIIEKRNKYFCHTDPTDLPPVQLRVEITVPGLVYSTRYFARWLEPQSLNDFIKLCEFQLKRIQSQLLVIYPHLLPSNEALQMLQIRGASEIIIDVLFPGKQPKIT